MLLPALMLLVALLVQPACLLYARAVMASTAGELARLCATTSEDDEGVRAYALRRLGAVPDVALFHEGGPQGWEVGVERRDGRVTVCVEGLMRPLPLLGVLATGFGEVRDGMVVLRERASRVVAPGWVTGTYDEWVGVWG